MIDTRPRAPRSLIEWPPLNSLSKRWDFIRPHTHTHDTHSLVANCIVFNFPMLTPNHRVWWHLENFLGAGSVKIVWMFVLHNIYLARRSLRIVVRKHNFIWPLLNRSRPCGSTERLITFQIEWERPPRMLLTRTISCASSRFMQTYLQAFFFGCVSFKFENPIGDSRSFEWLPKHGVRARFSLTWFASSCIYIFYALGHLACQRRCVFKFKKIVSVFAFKFSMVGRW